MIGDLKEVRYDWWCKTCKHVDKPEDEEPCFTCLNEPGNTDSHKPTKWEDK